MENPSAYVGKNVTISSRAEEIFTPWWFKLDEQQRNACGIDNHLLVIGKAPCRNNLCIFADHSECAAGRFRKNPETFLPPGKRVTTLGDKLPADHLKIFPLARTIPSSTYFRDLESQHAAIKICDVCRHQMQWCCYRRPALRR